MANPRRFVAGTVTSVAPVAALPTSAAHFVLQNGDSGGKTYTITRVGFTCTTSAAAVIKQQLLANVMNVSPMISGTVGSGPRPTDGGIMNSAALAVSAVTIPASGGVWHPVGTAVDFGAQTATIGTGNWVDVRGLYVLQPGTILALAVLCSAAGGAANQLFVQWEEEVL